MVQLKAHIFYLGYHRRRSDQVDFWIKCVTAVTSSASIAGWAIWQSYGFAWGLVIAVSQVISATKQYLPYETRRKSCNDTCKELENLFIQSESDWYYVSVGTLTNEEIHKKLISLLTPAQVTLPARGRVRTNGNGLLAVGVRWLDR